jgi:hypothetical protein
VDDARDVLAEAVDWWESQMKSIEHAFGDGKMRARYGAERENETNLGGTPRTLDSARRAIYPGT